MKNENWVSTKDMGGDLLKEIERRAKSHSLSFQTDKDPSLTRQDSLKSDGRPSNSSDCPTCGGAGYIGGTLRKEPYSVDRTYLVEVIAPTMQDCPECKRREAVAQFDPRRGMAVEDRDKYFSVADVDKHNAEAFDQALSIASHMEDHVAKSLFVYIYGDPVKARQAGKNAFGTGKSHLLCCMANEVAGKIPALFITETDLFAEIYDTYSGASRATESEVLSKYTSVPILFVDDLFKIKPTERVESLLFRIIEGRNKRGRVTVITSNVMPDRIHAVLNVETTAGAIESRLKGLSTMIELMGPDRRAK